MFGFDLRERGQRKARLFGWVFYLFIYLFKRRLGKEGFIFEGFSLLLPPPLIGMRWEGGLKCAFYELTCES